MKKIFSLFAAVLFAGSMMAADVLKATLDFTDSTNVWSLPVNSDAGLTADSAFSNGTYTIRLAATTKYYFKSGDNYLIFGKAGSTLTLPAFEWKTSKIVVTGRAGASGNTKQNIFVGEDAVSTETTGATGVNEYKIAADKQAAGTVYVLKVLSAHNTQVTKIEIFENDGTDPEPEPQPESPWAEIVFDKAIAADALPADTTFEAEGLKLAIVDTDNKMAIDANSANFGTKDAFDSYAFRLKTGGKGSSKNAMTLTVPADGLLGIAVRTGSNSDTTRTLVLSQGADTLYNAVVKEADAVEVAVTDSTTAKVYPFVTVPVKAGDVAIGYPIGSLNFYAFGFQEVEPEPEPIVAGDTLTCAAAAAAALAGDTTEVYVKGYVTSIAYAWKDGKMSFWMADSLKGGNVFEAYNCTVDSALAPDVTDLVVAHGKLKKYNSTAEFSGCTVEIIEKGEGPEIVDIDVVDCKSAAEAALSVPGNNVFYKDGQEFTVAGFVTSIQTPWASGIITFWMADDPEGGKVLEAYKCAIEKQEDAPNVGDKVKVTGKLTKYNTTPEFAEGCTCEIVEKSEAPKNLGPKTIAEFLALKNVKDTCILHGTITGLPEDKTANAWKYGNFDLVDETDTLYIYGLLTPDGEKQKFAEMGLENGSVIKIKAIYTEYQGKPQAANAILIPEAPELPEGVISCDSALVLARAIEDPVEVKATVEGPAVKVWGYVTFAYDAKDGEQSAWLSDTKGASGVIQGSYLEVSTAVAKGDYVQLEGTLAKYYKEGKNGNPNEIIIEVIKGKMTLVSELGVENVELTEKAQKVMVEGVLYIIRDNKMYNVQGIRVR